MNKLIFLLAVLFLLVPMASHAQTHTFCPTDATCTWTGPQTFNGPVSIPGNVSVGGTLGAKCVNGVCDAANATGADWCAKATNAAAALSGSVGKVTISAAAGTSVCAAALVVPSNVTLEWTQPGTYTTACAGITATSVSNVELFGHPGVVLTKPNACVNGSRTINILSSTNASVHDLEFNGNGNNQPSGEQSSSVFANDSSRIKIYHNILHDSQGDDVQLNADGNNLCDDILVEGNSFSNMGRDPVTLAGFGCNNLRVRDNYFNLGTLVTTSTTHGNPVHIEGDNVSTMFQGLVVSGNQAINQNGVCYSTTAQSGSPILGAIFSNNTCSGTNTLLALSGGVLLLQTQGASVTGNSVRWTGAGAGNNCFLVEDAPGVSAQTHRTVFADNTCDGATGDGISISGSQSSGTAQSFLVHHNTINNVTGIGIHSAGVVGDLTIDHNHITNDQAQGIMVNGAGRFSVDNNIIRDFGLGGVSLDGIVSTCGAAIGPGLIHDNTVGSTTTTSKIGIHGLCSATPTIYVYNNYLVDNATQQTLAGNYSASFPMTQILAPTDTPTAPGLSSVTDAGTGFSFPSAGVMFWSRATVRQIAYLNNIMRYGSGEVVGFSSAADPNSATSDGNISRAASGVVQAGTGETANANGEFRSARISATYNAAGTVATAVHLVQDTCTLGTSCGITLSGSAAYTGATTYTCTCHDQTTPLNACGVNQTGGGALTITGTGTDVIRYACIGN